MKKMKIILCVMLVMAMLIPTGVYAGSLDYIAQNDPVATPKAAPVIDGTPDPDEGWSDPAVLKKGYVKTLFDYNYVCASEADIYFAYDEGGLYYAADIEEFAEVDGVETNNTFMYSEGEDWIDCEGPNAENIAGFDGDVFVLALDPLGLYIRNGYITATDYTVWYCVGLFEGDEARLYRTRANAGDITDEVRVSGKRTEKGWSFEAYLPWELIIADMETYTYGRATCKAEELIEGGAQFRSAAIYFDRFDDPEMGEVNTRGAYMTSCTNLHDGSPSHMMKGHFAALYGLNFYIEYNEPAFADVSKGIWYYDAVKFCYNHNYMNGTSQTYFSPASTVTREMFVKVLANLSKADLSSYTESSFKDVKEGSWYASAVEWAYQNGLTSGMSEERFGVGQAVTREQLAAFLTRYAEYIHKNTKGRTDLGGFSDAGKISSWAKESVSWMVYKGFMKGMDDNRFEPKGKATRAQMAVLINNFMSEYRLDVFS